MHFKYALCYTVNSSQTRTLYYSTLNSQCLVFCTRKTLKNNEGMQVEVKVQVYNTIYLDLEEGRELQTEVYQGYFMVLHFLGQG